MHKPECSSSILRDTLAFLLDLRILNMPLPFFMRVYNYNTFNQKPLKS
jgi:hypothetical protein